jgi:NAD(P)H dehydrogenase (quinone)
MYFEHGLSGPIETILFPIHHGMLCFTGFSVVTPFIVHAPARIAEQERTAQLARYRECVLGLSTAPIISYPRLAEYDERYVLRAATQARA